MEIIRLPQGEQAPDEVDCISIEQQDNGRFELTGTALIACGDSNEAESVALVSLPPYESYAAAEEAGLAWAAQQCVERLYITRIAFEVPQER
ncbi:hypothetical protein [Sphingomonas aracearum]|uniref:Uncharacterized protein n=1 Tax=Sphingomonas aracearum TaxID=2283317 RepID=A0A369VWM5_9SPHN|nr:hypothetical protein [Sphingomonas aracearum]RDE05977.1 hypothetical protein DVW87_12415 [Sphingomonas aracearum]